MPGTEHRSARRRLRVTWAADMPGPEPPPWPHFPHCPVCHNRLWSAGDGPPRLPGYGRCPLCDAALAPAAEEWSRVWEAEAVAYSNEHRPGELPTVRLNECAEIDRRIVARAGPPPG